MALISPISRVVSVATAVGIALMGSVACGSSPDSPDQTRTSTAAKSACNAVTNEQVLATVGTAPDDARAVAVDKPGESTCHWTAGGKALLSLTTYTAPVDLAAEERGLKSGPLYDTKSLSPGIGESSFFRLAGPDEKAGLVFRKGATLYVLTARNQGAAELTLVEEQTARLKLASLARQVG